ncbi:MAG: saccharopine dehydrogenase C-terminal domain-containing protein [Bacteroidia bacterium]
MKKILVIGAGRSTVSLIDYLIKNATSCNWHVTVADMDLKLAQSKTGKNPNATAIQLDVSNEELRKTEINKADFVVSMLPAFMHGPVAKNCVELGKHLATASYVSEQMQALDKEAKQKGILLLNECGLDPGIDHASAMKIIDDVHAEGGEIISFKSFCGGLVAPESNDNPWGYKFSWNPRNVILAGQGTAHYLENGEIKYIPYNRVFTQTEMINVERHGSFEAYANRDSLGYQIPYGLQKIKTLLRGTLRMPGYCNAWNVFVKLGMTDDTYAIKDANKFTYSSWLSSYLPKGTGDLRERLADFMRMEATPEALDKIAWLGFFDNVKIELREGTPAQILQNLLEKKWLLKDNDKDMIVMQHLFEIDNSKNSKLPKKIISSLVVKGEDQNHTAMAKTVGLPLAICIKNFLTGKFNLTGVQIPTDKRIYLPLLEELKDLGVVFEEKEIN